jgi:hypothetical protein
MVKYGIWIRISVFPYSGEKVGSHNPPAPDAVGFLAVLPFFLLASTMAVFVFETFKQSAVNFLAVQC